MPTPTPTPTPKRAPPGPDDIQLLGEYWKPRLPPSFVIREEILQIAVADNERGMRALGAALGVTWGHPTVALKASYSRSNFDPHVYGGLIWDELRGMGCSMTQLSTEGNKALQAMARSVPTAEAVDERVGFSDPAASSTGEADEDEPAGSS
jgi:hypothetical protein